MKDKILEWLVSGKVGASSKAMACCILDLPSSKKEICHPLDPADFNRCLLFLEDVPEAREYMSKLVSLSDTWANLVDRWDELEKCFLDEVGLDWSKGHLAFKTYTLMKEIGC